MKHQKNDKKTIKIACKGSGEISISLLTPLQGNLKTISKENLDKLKNEIITDGYSFPICIWEDPDKNKLFILDGHQRFAALNALKKDGYSIPEIPIVMVEADSYEQAKHKLLAAASQYGKPNLDGLQEFLADVSFDLPDLVASFDLSLDFDKLSFDMTEPKLVDVEGHKREIGGESKSEPKIIEDDSKFLILITCTDENAQQMMFEEFKTRGLDCKIIN